MAESVCILAIASTGMAQSAGSIDAVDRSMQFVQRSMAATDLLNAGKPAEALPILQELAGRDAALDADGYAALSLGDCLAQLNRPDEARRTFLATAADHPERKAEVDQRLLDLELAGPITDDLILRLRAAAGASDESRFVGAWNLGRALQKRAKVLIDEALNHFSTAGEGGLRGHSPSLHRALLADVSEQLGSAIAQMENRWRQGADDDAIAGSKTVRPTPPNFASCRVDWTMQSPGGKAIRVEVRQDKPDDKAQVSVEGKSVELSRAQAALLRLHQERIARILSEAAGKGD